MSLSSSSISFAPVPFIQANDSGRFSIDDACRSFLEDSHDPLIVVTVAGLYRTGKSFILNQLSESMSGFELGSTIRPQTKGLWLWSSPHTLFRSKLHPDTGRTEDVRCRLILLDTEGIASFTQNDTHDVKVFALSLLLSSFFMYNSVGSIDESAIERLSLVCEISKHIRIQSDYSGNSEQLEDLAQYFPPFVWLVRDFSLRLVDEHDRAITPKDYLDMALQPQLDGDSDQRKSKNKIRTTLKTLFPQRDCMTLVRPVTNEDQLQNMSKLSPEELRPEFRAQIEHLKSFVFRKAPMKMFRGACVTGSMLLKMAETYIEAVNTGVCPVIATAWEAVALLENERILRSSLELIRSRMSLFRDEIFEDSEMEEQFGRIRNDAIAFMKDKGLGEEKMEYVQKIEEFLLVEVDACRKLQHARSRELCESVIEALTEALQTKIRARKDLSLEILKKDIRTLVRKYNEHAKGPSRESLLIAWLSGSLLDILGIVVDKRVSMAESPLKKRIYELEVSQEDAHQRLEKEIERFSLLVAEKDNEMRNLRDSLDSAEREMKRAQQDSQAAREKVVALENQVQDLSDEISAVQRERDEIFELTEIFRREKSLLEKSRDELSMATKSMQIEMDSLERKLAESDREKTQTHSRLRDRLREMDREKNDLFDCCNRLRHSLRESQTLGRRSSELELELQRANETSARALEVNRRILEENSKLSGKITALRSSLDDMDQLASLVMTSSHFPNQGLLARISESVRPGASFETCEPQDNDIHSESHDTHMIADFDERARIAMLKIDEHLKTVHNLSLGIANDTDRLMSAQDVVSEKNLHVEVQGSVTDRVGCVTPPPHLLAIESFREKDLMASLTSNSPTSAAPDLSSEMHPLKQTQIVASPKGSDRQESACESKQTNGLNADNIDSASETDRLARTTRRLPPTPASRRYSSELPRKNISDDEFMNTPSADNSNTTGSFTLFPDLNGSSRRLPLSDEKSSSGRVSQNRARSLGSSPDSGSLGFNSSPSDGTADSRSVKVHSDGAYSPSVSPASPGPLSWNSMLKSPSPPVLVPFPKVSRHSPNDLSLHDHYDDDDHVLLESSSRLSDTSVDISALTSKLLARENGEWSRKLSTLMKRG